MALTAEVRHNLFLAFKEAVHNVVKHAGASEARASLELRASEVILAIEDNGCGFASNGSANSSAPHPDRYASGNGLANMKRRMTEIRGRCEIQSTPGQGTKVWFVVAIHSRHRETGPPVTNSLS